MLYLSLSVSLSPSVCVCVRESERERENLLTLILTVNPGSFCSLPGLDYGLNSISTGVAILALSLLLSLSPSLFSKINAHNATDTTHMLLVHTC